MGAYGRSRFRELILGGATHDLPPGWLARCEKFLDQFVPVIDEYHALLTTNAIFVRRTAGIGVLPAPMAIDYGCTGPVLRGSGVDHDLRRDGDRTARLALPHDDRLPVAAQWRQRSGKDGLERRRPGDIQRPGHGGMDAVGQERAGHLGVDAIAVQHHRSAGLVD